MKIPKYIQDHIEMNNKLLEQARKHSEIVLDWYSRKMEKLDFSDSGISDEEFSEIQENIWSNGAISISAIKENFKLLEDGVN